MTTQPTKVIPIILAGGGGTRLWPLSRSLHPKQYLSLDPRSGSGSKVDQTLFQQTAARVAALATPDLRIEPPCVIANEEHRFTVVEQLHALGLDTARILLESVGRNTAPALTLAALACASSAQEGGATEDPVLLVIPSDHAISDQAVFAAALRKAITVAQTGSIVALGIKPDRPDTGYGYICTFDRNGSDAMAARVSAFVEKPDLAHAERYVADGRYSWNSGMFVLRSSVWLAALGAYRPDIAVASEAAWQTATVDGPFTRFDKKIFGAIPPESIDYAVMEPASQEDSGFDIRVVPLDAGWSDLGAWDAVWRVNDHDADGNFTHGDAIVKGSRNTFVHASSRLVGVIGLEDVTIVETADAVLVAHRSQSGAVKDLVGDLIGKGRSEAFTHQRVHRPWGWYESVDQGPRFQVKRILVNPGARLSLQMHHHRAEHWIVVAGTAEVTKGSTVVLLTENQSTYIQLGETHRLANPGKLPLEIIEVQSGSYLGEDDIVRFEDNYGRH